MSVTLKKQQTMYAVDLPMPDRPTEAWINVDYFGSKKAAVKWCQDNLGADKQGRISLVSRIEP